MGILARLGILGSAIGLLALLAHPAEAACPANLCDCLGNAGRYAVSASQLQVKSGKISSSGYAYAIPTLIEGSACSQTGKIGGKAGGETSISDKLLLTAAPGLVAAKFSGYKYYGYAYPGAFVEGDVATGGGSLAGLGFVEIGGTTDTTGNYPEMSSCSGALLDAGAASDTLAALTPTQTLTDVLVSNGDTVTITGTAGVNVVNVNSINVKAGRDDYGSPLPSTLELSLPSAAAQMI
jgi:hypothetical protein